MMVRVTKKYIEEQNHHNDQRKTQQVHVQPSRGGPRVTTIAAKKAIYQSLDKQNDDNGDRVSPR